MALAATVAAFGASRPFGCVCLSDNPFGQIGNAAAGEADKDIGDRAYRAGALAVEGTLSVLCGHTTSNLS